MSSGQLSLPTILKHNNQQLFSDHYLDTILPQQEEWRSRRSLRQDGEGGDG